MVAKSDPGDVVGMLNTLYERFDRITHVHNTYRVSRVSPISDYDKYLFIAGLYLFNGFTDNKTVSRAEYKFARTKKEWFS